MTILEGHITWSGWQGGPGYTVLHITNAGIMTSAIDNLVGAMQHMADQLHFLVPNSVSLTPSKEVKEFDAATGELVSINTSPAAASTWVGAGGAAFAAPVGAVIGWGTSGVNRGRRVKGRSFIVPLSSGQFEADGTLTSGALASLNTVALDYRSSGGYESVVWSRPRLGVGGAAFPITSHRVPDMAAVLRSRRD